MNPISIEISQAILSSMLLKVRCASQSTGTMSEPGKLLIKVAKGRLIVHVQGRQMVATAWEKLKNLDPAANESVVVDFARFYQIISTHDSEDNFIITLKDPSCVDLSSGVGAWKLITDDRKSYEALNYKGDVCGTVEVKDFNKMVTSASILADTSKRSTIDSGARMYHMDGSLHMFFATGTEAAILAYKLAKPFTSDFDVFLKSWVLKHLSLSGSGEAIVSTNTEDEVLIFETDNTKIVVSVSTDVSMNWEDATQRMDQKEPGEQTEITNINKLALKASLARLSKVSEGTIDLQILSKEQANLHSQLKAGDRGDEKLTVFTNVKSDKKANPTKTTLIFSLNILKSITNIDTEDENLQFEYEVNTTTGIASIALFNGVLTNTAINVQVVFPVGI